MVVVVVVITREMVVTVGSTGLPDRRDSPLDSRRRLLTPSLLGLNLGCQPVPVRSHLAPRHLASNCPRA